MEKCFYLLNKGRSRGLRLTCLDLFATFGFTKFNKKPAWKQKVFYTMKSILPAY